MWRYELHPPYLMLLHYLVKFEKPKMHVTTTSSFNVNYKIAATSIKLHWQFHKWTFRSEHVLKMSTTSMHTWSQMVTPALMMFRSKSKQVCIERFRRLSMSWIFVSYPLCCITPQISKMMTLVHSDEAMIQLIQFSLVISGCNITFSMFCLIQGSVATLIRRDG